MSTPSNAPQSLLETMRALDGHPTPEVARGMMDKLCTLELLEDVQATITFSDGTSYVNLEPQTAMGSEVLFQVASSSDFIPCPPGDCEFLPSGTCRWCGAVVGRS